MEGDSLESAVLALNLPKKTRLLVAVSGGPDSVALLHTFAGLASHPDRQWALRAGHINHGLRGDDAGDDQRFVQDLAAGLDIPVEVVAVDTRGVARESRLSLETAARAARYAALREMLRAWPGDFIATGHTLDDQAETFMLRLLRGTGLTGLEGMRAQRGDLIRPFLSVERRAIHEFLKERSLPYQLDASNLDPQHTRNRLRLEVMNHLEEIQPNASRLLARTATLLQTDGEYLRREARQALEWVVEHSSEREWTASASVWRSFHPALRRLTLRLILEEMAGTLDDVEEAHIRLLSDAIERGRSVRLHDQLPHGIHLDLDGDYFVLHRGSPEDDRPVSPVSLSIPGSVTVGEGRLSARIRSVESGEELDNLKTVCGPYHALCDADEVGPRLNVRSRRPGDRMRPLGAGGSRKLQDIMVDARVPIRDRITIPVIENGRHIVWIPGIALDDRSALREDSRSVLDLRFEP